MGYDEEPVTLSREGEARRARMLGELQGALSRRVRRRMAGRVAAAFLCVAGLATVFWPQPQQPDPLPVPPPRAEVSVVRTDPSVLARLSVPTAVRPETLVATTCRLEDYRIDDKELLQLMAEAGRPCGVARRDGQFFLLEAPTRSP